MKLFLLFPLALNLSTQVWADGGDRHLVFENETRSKWTWLPVILDKTERELLIQRESPPRKALDYYLLLPKSYFRNIENSIERRIAFIERDSLNDQYLHAEFSIPRTDGGAFGVTIRVFQKEGEPLIAVQNIWSNELLYENKEAKRGELRSISVRRPEFWRYRDGNWIAEADKIVADIKKETVLDLYYNHYRAHLNFPDQRKRIFLEYSLPREGNTIRVTGRENFMSPSEEYVWEVFSVASDPIKHTTESEQDAADQLPARRKGKAP